MSGHEPTSESRGGPEAGLSPTEATRLWGVFWSEPEPDAMEALDRLYRCLRRPLVEFCRLKGCDPELADEVAERTWAKLLINRPRARKGFIPLMHKTAQNLCYEELRSRRSTLVSDAQVAPDESVGAALERGETARTLTECLAQLDREDCAFFLCVHAYGLTRKAACELLGWDIAPSTAHQRLERIRTQLAALLKKKSIL